MRERWRAALSPGGKTLYEGTLGDLTSDPVPPDQALRELLDSVWDEVLQTA